MSSLTWFDLYYGDAPCDGAESDAQCDEEPIFVAALEGRDRAVYLCIDHMKEVSR